MPAPPTLTFHLLLPKATDSVISDTPFTSEGFASLGGYTRGQQVTF